MSGGTFNYQQYVLDDIARSILRLIRENDKLEHPYSANTIRKFKKAVETLHRAAKMVHCIDWLVAGDTDEDDAWDKWPKAKRGGKKC